MNQTLVAQSSTTVCSSCSRTVRIVPVDGKMVAVDPEVIAVVPVGRHGGTLAAASSTTGRRVHAELCETYQRDDRRQERRKEIAAYEKKQGKRRGL